MSVLICFHYSHIISKYGDIHVPPQYRTPAFWAHVDHNLSFADVRHVGSFSDIYVCAPAENIMVIVGTWHFCYQVGIACSLPTAWFCVRGRDAMRRSAGITVIGYCFKSLLSGTSAFRCFLAPEHLTLSPWMR